MSTLIESFEKLCQYAVTDQKILQPTWSIMASMSPPPGSSLSLPCVMTCLYHGLTKEEATSKCLELMPISSNPAITLRVIPSIGLFFSTPGEESKEYAVDSENQVHPVVRPPQDKLKEIQDFNDKVQAWTEKHWEDKKDRTSLAYASQCFWNLYRQSLTADQINSRLADVENVLKESKDFFRDDCEYSHSQVRDYMAKSLEDLGSRAEHARFWSWSESVEGSLFGPIGQHQRSP